MNSRRSESPEEEELIEERKPRFSNLEQAHINRQLRKRKWLKRFEWVNLKAQALLWIGFSIFIIYATNIFHQIATHPSVNRFFLNIGLVGIGMLGIIMLYLTFYLPYIARSSVEWEVSDPNLIPTATIIAVATFFSVGIAIWPLWSFLTFPMLGVIFMGFINTSHFLPPGYYGNYYWISIGGICMFGIFILALLSPLWIKGEGWTF